MVNLICKQQMRLQTHLSWHLLDFFRPSHHMDQLDISISTLSLCIILPMLESNQPTLSEAQKLIESALRQSKEHPGYPIPIVLLLTCNENNVKVPQELDKDVRQLLSSRRSRSTQTQVLQLQLPSVESQNSQGQALFLATSTHTHIAGSTEPNPTATLNRGQGNAGIRSNSYEHQMYFPLGDEHLEFPSRRSRQRNSNIGQPTQKSSIDNYHTPKQTHKWKNQNLMHLKICSNQVFDLNSLSNLQSKLHLLLLKPTHSLSKEIRKLKQELYLIYYQFTYRQFFNGDEKKIYEKSYSIFFKKWLANILIHKRIHDRLDRSLLLNRQENSQPLFCRGECQEYIQHIRQEIGEQMSIANHINIDSLVGILSHLRALCRYLCRQEYSKQIIGQFYDAWKLYSSTFTYYILIVYEEHYVICSTWPLCIVNGEFSMASQIQPLEDALSSSQMWEKAQIEKRKCDVWYQLTRMAEENVDEIEKEYCYHEDLDFESRQKEDSAPKQTQSGKFSFKFSNKKNSERR